MRASGEFEAMPKKEALILGRELEKLERNLGGLRTMRQLPEAVFVIDTKKEHIAVTEANKLGIPVVAVVDTNCDPDVIQYVIPGNDDAIRSASLLCRVISDAVEEGRYMSARRGVVAGAAAPVPERSPEDEAAFQAAQSEARHQAAAAQAEREARLARTKTEPAAQAAVAPEEPAEPAPAAEEPAAEADEVAAVDTESLTIEIPQES
jgi:small subunit ribosomal protein S2